MGNWTLDTIAWDRFDASKVDPEILRNIKAAAMVERNGGDYGIYLGRVFADDPAVRGGGRHAGSRKKSSTAWRSAAGRSLPIRPGISTPPSRASATATSCRSTPTSSVRGSQAGEMMARCIVETGTSSYYSALKDATDEPVLKQICAKIAADEFRHYKLFYEHLRRCLERDRLSRWSRLRIGWGRIAESEDDELAYAYFAANEPAGAVYDRKRYMRRLCPPCLSALPPDPRPARHGDDAEGGRPAAAGPAQRAC